MRKGDIIAIAIVTLVTFPILYVVMLFATGALHIEYGFEKQNKEEEIRVERIRHNSRRDSLAAMNSKIFEAVRQERADLAKEHERVTEQYGRLEMLQAEIEKSRGELVKERAALEARLADVPDEEAARIRQLSKIYGAMKPGEAAAIMETLPDAMVAKILAAMGDDRQKGRILATLSKEKAARINKIIK